MSRAKRVDLSFCKLLILDLGRIVTRVPMLALHDAGSPVVFIQLLAWEMLKSCDAHEMLVS